MGSSSILLSQYEHRLSAGGDGKLSHYVPIVSRDRIGTEAGTQIVWVIGAIVYARWAGDDG